LSHAREVKGCVDWKPLFDLHLGRALAKVRIEKVSTQLLNLDWGSSGAFRVWWRKVGVKYVASLRRGPSVGVWDVFLANSVKTKCLTAG
jgi:hypothetical protein